MNLGQQRVVKDGNTVRVFQGNFDAHDSEWTEGVIDQVTRDTRCMACGKTAEEADNGVSILAIGFPDTENIVKFCVECAASIAANFARTLPPPWNYRVIGAIMEQHDVFDALRPVDPYEQHPDKDVSEIVAKMAAYRRAALDSIERDIASALKQGGFI